ncbi:cytochrome c5 family protein [Parahaliea maris]|uniref:Cytochrome c5 family protein n=1 Tax=Parahaliea maris TaxID=2716870 RepID=A0A5C8ZYN1_9GAMM|nr:c-type cytochrome [Parahaliea maris]TXS93685.1 cytochrome c5 family protein [Parahaliea maris]
MKKLIAAAAAVVTTATFSALVQAEVPMDKYNKSCAICHAAGTAGAPKTHDVAAWKPRLEKGDAKMLESIHNGFNAMPPKGMCFDCNDEDYKALIDFMSTAAK